MQEFDESGNVVRESDVQIDKRVPRPELEGVEYLRIFLYEPDSGRLIKPRKP